MPTPEVVDIGNHDESFSTTEQVILMNISLTIWAVTIKETKLFRGHITETTGILPPLVL